jgi:hypothetical protein
MEVEKSSSITESPVGVVGRLSRRLSGSVGWTAALSLLFFVLNYLYLWQVVDLRLIYHGGGIILNFPVFYRGWEFFRETASWPGGLVEYISAFFAQFFYVGWAGALVATVQAWLLWQCSGSIMRGISGRRVRWVCFIPAICLLVIYSRYSYQFTIVMALLVALGFVCLYLRVPLPSKPLALLVFLVLSIVLYAIAGWVYLLFAVLCAIYELLVGRRWLMGVMYLVAAPVVSYIEGLLVFDMSIIYALRHLRSFSYEAGTVILTVLCILYLFLPVTVTGLWLAGLFCARAARYNSSKAEKNESNQASRFSAGWAGITLNIVGWLLPFVMGVVAVGLSYSDDLKMMLEVNYYAYRRMWPEVLQTARGNPDGRFTSCVVNRALYHTGRLAEEMFAYPQRPEALFMQNKTSETVFWELFDICIDLGQMNLAEYSLLISIGKYGEQPILLRRLVLVNMVKGRTGAAKVCLGALSRTLFDAGWAMEYLAKIKRDPNLSTDKEIQQLRSMMPTKDRNFASSVDENILLDLLDKDRRNRMAFEYLMGVYLLAGQFDKFIGNLDRLDDFDYTRIPRVYEEAILLYSYMRDTRVELRGREISSESRERLNNFLNVYLGRYREDKTAAFNELARDYGDSYLFYCLYGQSGMKK